MIIFQIYDQWKWNYLFVITFNQTDYYKNNFIIIKIAVLWHLFIKLVGL